MEGVRRKRPPRIPGFDYTGLHVYFLTICAEHRSPIFRDTLIATAVCTHLLHIARAYRFAVIAYCLMPDHMHALVEALSDDSALLKFVTMFKQRTAFEYRRATGKRLWQEGYYDRVVRDDEPVLGIAAYILHNPIRAQLCTRVSDYPFLGSDRYTIAELIDSVQFQPGGSRPSKGRRYACVRSRP